MVVLQITDCDIEKSQAFMLERCMNVELYRHRGGFKPRDIMIGALAEIGVYKFLKSLDIQTAHPDFSIHETAHKSYDADLTDGNLNFHVKGQGRISADRYGSSWLFQKHDPLLVDPENKHYIIPATVDVEAKTVYIHACIPAKTVKSQSLLGDCKVPHLRATKKALYLDDIDDKLGNNIAQRWSILNV